MQNIKLEIYNNNKVYLFPNMKPATPEIVARDYAAVNITKCVVTSDISGEMFYAIEPLNAMVQRLDIDITNMLSDEEKLVAMENKLNEPAPVPQPSAQDRIAAAMEYQNLLSM
jgi:hypothetical protein